MSHCANCGKGWDLGTEPTDPRRWPPERLTGMHIYLDQGPRIHINDDFDFCHPGCLKEWLRELVDLVVGVEAGIPWDPKDEERLKNLALPRR
jgi:hypothetical protein